MEFTETEIKMFREAEEIQALYPWGDDIACGVIQNCLYLSADEPSKSILLDAGGNLWFEGGFVDDLPRLPKATIHIWLPTQEQLQGMVFDSQTGVQTIATALEEFSKTSVGCSISIFGSMRTLWLAFVMHEKYQKVWNGETWVKETSS